MTLIGIDLGTTNSLAAIMTPAGPRTLPNSLGEVLTPSVVGIDLDNQLLVGRAAKELQVMHPERCVSLFKRYMGADWSATLVGRRFSAEQLSSLVLRSLAADAEAHLGTALSGAVITVPAYFNDQQRKATIHAGQIAGLKVERIINEPTAAALAYGFHEGKQEKLILICDLGGGTFDVSLVDFFEGAIEVRASSGESFLGGEDFSRTMAARILTELGFPFERTELDHPALVARTIQQCEIAKCRLSREERATVRIADISGALSDASQQVAVLRNQLQTWTQPLLARVEWPIRRVLGDAHVAPPDIDEVILVGGATRMPAFVEMVTQIFGKEPRHRLNPDEVVALGAAVQAALIEQDASVSDLVATDVCPFTLGIEISKELGGEHRSGYFLPIIERNTTIPVTRVKNIATLEPSQTEVIVRVFQGENRRVEHNLALGEFRVTGIPRAPAGDQQVNVRFTYDLNGILEAEATVVKTGAKFEHVITKHAAGLSPAQIARARAEMQQLKHHPREDSANRFLLRRAERVFGELSLDDRNLLSTLIDAFEEALELRDAAAIEQCGSILSNFLDAHDLGGPSSDSSFDGEQHEP